VSSPRLLTRLGWVIVALLGCAATALGAWAVVVGGIAWDTRSDLLMFAEVRSIDPAAGLAAAYDGVDRGGEFYGILIQQTAEVVREALTGRPARSNPDDPGTYLWLSWVTFTTAVLAAAAVGWAVSRTLRSRLAGATAAALLMATPLWLGMAALDHKDMPVAAGLTLVSSALAVTTRRPAPPESVVIAFTAALGGLIAVGTRPGAIALLAALLGFTLLILISSAWRDRSPRRALALGGVAAVALGAGVLGLWAFNPLARINVVQWLRDSIATSSSFPYDGLIRTAGVDVRSTEIPWWYVPAWLLAQLPILTTVLLLTTLVLAGLAFLRRRHVPRPGPTRGWRRAPGPRPLTPGEGTGVLGLTGLLSQATVLPALIVISGAVLYDGIRHLLFVLPGLAALAGIGICLIEGRGLSGRVTGPLLAGGTAVIVVAASLWAEIRWVPYAYAFVNPIAGWNRAEPAWELDYWGATSREGVRATKEACIRERSRCAPFVIVFHESDTAEPFGGLNAEDPLLAGRAEYAVYEFWRGGEWDSQVPPGCTARLAITRDGHTLGRGYLCRTDESATG